MPWAATQSAGSGGMKQQLVRLRAGLHPVTGDRLLAARDSEGRPLCGSGLYSRLTPSVSSDPKFSPYVPFTFASAVPQVGRSAEDKRKHMLARIRGRPAIEARTRKRLRKLEARMNLTNLIDLFVAEPLDVEREPTSQVDLDEEFWKNKSVGRVRRERLRGVPDPPAHAYRGRAVELRCKQLGVHRNAVPSRGCTVLTCFVFGCNGGHL